MEPSDTVIVTTASTGKRVVLIEDDADLFELVRYNLSREGFEVSGSRTGRESVELCERARPDVILLDVMLPDSDGYEICRKLKAHHSLSHVPVIFLTARGTESDRVLGLELGATDYMVKPFSVRELAARIKTHLRPQNDQTLPVLRAGQLELDRYRHRVRRDGVEVALTATEFRLLEFMMERPGLVLTRGQLLDGVWGRADALTERVVDVYVLRLRNKIEGEGAEQEFIRSVRGYGYSFEDPTRHGPAERAS
jgi:DNA-binding response OmpR family regulator